MSKVKEFLGTLMEPVTLTKKEILLTTTTCVLAGIVLGIILAPKKYVKIGSDNIWDVKKESEE